MSDNLTSFINAKLGIEERQVESNERASLFLMSEEDVINNTFFVKGKLNELDYDTLYLSILHHKGCITREGDKANIIITNYSVNEVHSKALYVNEKQFIYEYIRGRMNVDQTEQNIIKLVVEEHEANKESPKGQKKRIIPLDDKAFKSDSLLGKKISFAGNFRHFNEKTIYETIINLGGDVVSIKENYDFFVCGRDINPMEITDSLVKLMSETDFIRMISK
jgi:hypothetical protein